MDKYWKDTENELIKLLLELCMDEGSFEKIKVCKTKEDFLSAVNKLENENLKTRLKKIFSINPEVVSSVLQQFYSDFLSLERIFANQ